MENENYFFGKPDGDFNDVLNELSHTKVNSFKTSSIPLAGFWKPSGNLQKENAQKFNGKIAELIQSESSSQQHAF